MAQIVGGFGVPHTPIFPHFVKRDGPDCEIARLFGAQKDQLAATRPDVIVMFDTDHLNTFFLDSLPVFALGVDKTFRAPNDEPRDVPNYVVPSAPDLAAHIRQAGIEAGFDVGMTQNFSVDHSVIVPLHFLTPDMHVPGDVTVLVIDNAHAMRFLTRVILEGAGYRVLDAGDVPQAEALLTDHSGPVDLLIADMTVPGSSRRDLLRRLVEARPKDSLTATQVADLFTSTVQSAPQDIEALHTAALVHAILGDRDRATSYVKQYLDAGGSPAR